VYIFRSFLLPSRLRAEIMVFLYFPMTLTILLTAVHMFLYLCSGLIGPCM
jgi:hypothetical protein